jgi:SAM-dependent methyltransferase
MAYTMEEIDALYADAKARSPGLKYTRFFCEFIADQIDTGLPHATLGPVLKSGLPWAESGAKQFDIYRRLFGITPDKRLVDYGCGSLRLGVHFIRLLDPGHYVGLDPIPRLVAWGEKLAGDLLTEKGATARPFSPEAIADAEAFGADFVMSHAVAFHIHPDETAEYFGTLARLARKPGATVFFDAKTTATPLRYANSGWSWPRDFYIDAMKPLRLVKVHAEKPYPLCGGTTGHFEFKRD